MLDVGENTNIGRDPCKIVLDVGENTNIGRGDMGQDVGENTNIGRRDKRIRNRHSQRRIISGKLSRLREARGSGLPLLPKYLVRRTGNDLSFCDGFSQLFLDGYIFKFLSTDRGLIH